MTDKNSATIKQWYIWYTKPRAEKKVKERLEAKGEEVFLPVYKELRQWSDRKKWIESPLFSGYIFVRSLSSKFDSIAFTEGVLNFVRYNGKPAMLRLEEVEEIKLLLSDYQSIEVDDAMFHHGEQVKIIAGPLQGLEGEIINHKGKKRLAVRIEQLGKAILVEVPKVYVKRQLRA